MKEQKIRDVNEKDAERLVEIYSYYVKNTAVSFEYDAPTVEEFADRIKKISSKYPYLVCEVDGKVVGYVYAGRYRERKAFDWTVETSIYIDKDCRKQGIGRVLYKELETRLKAQGIVSLLASIAYVEPEDEYLTNDSVIFHNKLGYEKVAHMKKVGYKFGRWYDLVWAEKIIL